VRSDYVGSYSQLNAAKSALARYLGVQVRKLPRRRKPRGPRQAFDRLRCRYVYPVRGTPPSFEVRTRHEYFGRFPTMKLARAAVRGIGLTNTPSVISTRAALLRKFIVVKHAFQDLVAREIAMRIFGLTTHMYAVHFPRSKDWWPADLQHLRQFRRQHEDFCLAPGPCYVFAAMGKDCSGWTGCMTAAALCRRRHKTSGLQRRRMDGAMRCVRHGAS
jgi:hypothetical protein